MLNNFFKHYGKKKLLDGVNALNDAIVSFDPEGATEAAISEMEENFDSINVEFSKSKSIYEKEQREADEIIKVRDQRLAAAEHISGQLEGDADNAQLNSALDQLLTSLEEMVDDIEMEVEEAADAKEIMEELDITVKMYADKLKSARNDMRKASNAMTKAKLKEERAEVKSARAAQQAGLRSTAGGISSALESMNKQAEEATANADAATRKAELLGGSKVEENDAVKAAMAAVSGEAPAPTSTKDRLAALRSKK